MKKLLFVVAVLALAIGTANAEEKYVAGGFEASGHLNTGFGFSYVGSNAAAANTGGAVTFARDGWTGFQAGAKAKDFGFILDEFELDVSKTFGENIKARVDLSFTDGTIGSPAYNMIEQAYVTANIATGNGIELLFGRFNVPIGFEAVDRNENDTVTRSHIFNYNLRPKDATGMKLYYAFTDAVDFHFYVVNNLGDDIAATTFNTDAVIIPSFGTRVGYTWGEEGTESTFGLSVAAGPEAVKAGSKVGYWSFLGDLDWNVWLTDAFALGGEGIFRYDQAITAGASANKIFGGLLNLHYVFSDVWDGTLKYALLRPNAGDAAGAIAVNDYALGAFIAKGFLHEIGLAGGYQITDGAKFKAEYRLDWTKYTGVAKNFSHAFLGLFAYEF